MVISCVISLSIKTLLIVINSCEQVEIFGSKISQKAQQFPFFHALTEMTVRLQRQVHSAMHLSIDMFVSLLIYNTFSSQVFCRLVVSLESSSGFTQMSYCIVYPRRHPQLVCIFSFLSQPSSFVQSVVT